MFLSIGTYTKVAFFCFLHIVLVEDFFKQIGIWVLSFDQPSATDILGFPMTRLGPKLKCPTGGQGGLYRPREKLSEENAAGWDVGDFKGVGSTNQEVSNNGE
jgi:hypothetical protein